MATEYGNRIAAAMDHAGLNQKALVEKSGLPQSTISSAMNRGEGSSFTVRIAYACDVTPLWLEANIGEMLGPYGNKSEFTVLSAMLEKTPKDLQKDALHAATLAMLPYVNRGTATATDSLNPPAQVANKSGKPRISAKAGNA